MADITFTYEYKAIVREVHDGDTVVLDVDQGFNEWHNGMHIRMAGMNAPELRHHDAAGAYVDNPDGIAARDFLRAHLPIGTKILLRSLKDKADKYGGRWDGIIWTGVWKDDVLLLPVNINELMIQAGHAMKRTY